MWQTLLGNDSGASGLVSAGGGTFLVVNEDTFWEVTLEPLSSQRLDFRIDGAVELEAICAIPWHRDHFFALEKNSGRVTRISRAGRKVIQQFQLTKQPEEILNFPDPRPGAPLDLAEIKRKVKELEPLLPQAPWQVLHTFERNGRFLALALTERLRKAAHKAGLWNSKEMATTLKNAAYGLEPEQTRSAGGRDGIYRVDRDYRPENEMMRKLFGRFLDKAEGDSLATELGTPKSELLPVRLVSHHMRLLGVLRKGADSDLLVLVDCDNT